MKKQNLFILSLFIFTTVLFLQMNSCTTDNNGKTGSTTPYIGEYTVDSLRIDSAGEFRASGSYTGTVKFEDLSDIGGFPITINGVEINGNATITISEGDATSKLAPGPISLSSSTTTIELTATSIRSSDYTATIVKESDSRITISKINAKTFFAGNLPVPTGYNVSLFLTKK